MTIVSKKSEYFQFLACFSDKTSSKKAKQNIYNSVGFILIIIMYLANQKQRH